MNKFNRLAFLACGLLLTLAATSVFAQEKEEIQLIRKPFEDFAQAVKEKVESKQIDLTKPFLVELFGVLDKDGELDPRVSKFTKSEGDAAMINVGKYFIEAINDSGLFYFLKQAGIKKVKLVLGQDEVRAYGIITSETPTAEKAKTIAGGVNAVISLVKTSLQQKQSDEDERILINGVSTGSTDKIFTLKMDYEKLIIQKMITRKLKESAAKKLNGE